MGYKLKKRKPSECRVHKGYFTDDGIHLYLRCWRCGYEIMTDSEFEEVETECLET